jgi:HEAT repeat protein
MKDELDQAVTVLAGESPILRATLTPFSGLERTDAARLLGLLATLPIERQRQVVEALVGEAERSFDLDFGQAFRALLHHGDATIRRLSLEGLTEDGRLNLIAPLIWLLEHDPDETVRATAASALGSFVYEGEIDELPSARALTIRQALERQFLSDQTPIEIARRALESLAFINDDTVKGYIDRAYSSDLEAMRISAVFAMGRNADPCWGDTVLAELYSDNPAMRYEAARSCGELQLREAVDMLARMIGERDAEVRFAAAQALGQIGGNEARAALERHLESEVPELREVVEEALAEASLSEMVFDLMAVDPLDDSLLFDDDELEATQEEDEEDNDLESFRHEFREYTDEDDDGDWPDEFLSLD